MVRTRSVAKLAIDGETPSDALDAAPASTFNGGISKFEYTTKASTNNPATITTTTTTTTTTTAKAKATTTTTKTTTLMKPTRSTPNLNAPRSSRPPSKRSTPSTPPPRSSTPLKKQRKSSSYAPPSKYAHLSPLTDILTPSLISIFIGTNPGIQTATAGHAYAHPSNHFWKLLHASGLTPDRRLSPAEDVTLPAKYALGNTNIVARPSKDAAELSRAEMVRGAGVLERKIARCRPESVCVVGKGIWEAVFRRRYGRALRKGEFGYGWQDGKENMGRKCWVRRIAGVDDDDDGAEDEGEIEGNTEEYGDGDGDEENGNEWEGARVFVATSTSGLAANIKFDEKVRIWTPFGEWVNMRRKERGMRERSLEEGGGFITGLRYEREEFGKADAKAVGNGEKD